MTSVFAFDRDHTVDVNQGPVPLDWVTLLRDRPDVKVIAIGNQALVDEADVDGLDWLNDELGIVPPLDESTDRDERVRYARDWAHENGYLGVYHVDDERVTVDGVAYFPPELFVETFEGTLG